MDDSNSNLNSSWISLAKKIQILNANLLSFRWSWSKLNSAMGDIGTYIPIVIALILATSTWTSPSFSSESIMSSSAFYMAFRLHHSTFTYKKDWTRVLLDPKLQV
ncbi:hypothetical protein SAY87_014856 [Trapa incisa]|uniref:Uncharacterized protein n=1 Tax=Trapa incisa TaxID=236973 RepID=A0AAN7JLG3_9MYRT|nr:hypothetical protein SAY87_014856 [Trapa incisa]